TEVIGADIEGGAVGVAQPPEKNVRDGMVAAVGRRVADAKTAAGRPPRSAYLRPFGMRRGHDPGHPGAELALELAIVAALIREVEIRAGSDGADRFAAALRRGEIGGRYQRLNAVAVPRSIRVDFRGRVVDGRKHQVKNAAEVQARRTHRQPAPRECRRL